MWNDNNKVKIRFVVMLSELWYLKKEDFESSLRSITAFLQNSAANTTEFFLPLLLYCFVVLMMEKSPVNNTCAFTNKVADPKNKR